MQGQRQTTAVGEADTEAARALTDFAGDDRLRPIEVDDAKPQIVQLLLKGPRLDTLAGYPSEGLGKIDRGYARLGPMACDDLVPRLAAKKGRQGRAVENDHALPPRNLRTSSAVHSASRQMRSNSAPK